MPEPSQPTPRLPYAKLAPEGIAALRAVEHYLNTGTALDPILLEYARLRASLVNGCGFCIGLHTAELRRRHEPETRISAVAEWAAAPDAFTPREQAVFAWTDSLTRVSQTHAPDADYAAISAFFSGKDLVDLTLAISSINAWNRLGIGFALEWNPRPPSQSTNTPPEASHP